MSGVVRSVLSITLESIGAIIRMWLLRVGTGVFSSFGCRISSCSVGKTGLRSAIGSWFAARARA